MYFWILLQIYPSNLTCFVLQGHMWYSSSFYNISAHLIIVSQKISGLTILLVF